MTEPIYIAFDTETWLIRPGLLAPPLVVGSFAETTDGAFLLLRDDCLTAVEALLDDERAHLIGHNMAFDMGVVVHARPSLLPKVFAAYDAGRIHDTRTRDKMILNARGELKDDGNHTLKFGLADVVKRRFGVEVAKGADTWRLRYSELDDVPLDQWPEEALSYAKDDAVWTLRCFQKQEEDRYEPDPETVAVTDFLADEARHTRAAWSLHLMAMWGLRTDASKVNELEHYYTHYVAAGEDHLKRIGLLKGKTVKGQVEWSKDMGKIRELVTIAFKGNPPKTAPSGKFPEGQIKTDAETLAATGHPDLVLISELAEADTQRSRWLDALKEGVTAPVNPGWNELVSSSRTSAFKPPMQQPPRNPLTNRETGEKLPGVRECFVPRPGYWYLSADYSFLELCVWAQNCLDLVGKSRMAESIRAGLDPHVDMGVEILRAEGHPAMTHRNGDYDIANKARKAGEKWAKDARQLAKAANFGLPGGLGAATFVAYAKATYDVVLTEDEAKALKSKWLQKWPEAQLYFNYVSSLSPYGDAFTITLPRTGFVRGGCSFTAGCNGYFQGVAACGAKEAMWRIAWDCYNEVPWEQRHAPEGTVRQWNSLHGCRPVLFLHDEFILEVPADVNAANAAAQALQRHMIEAMQTVVPDVPIKTEPTLMTRWYKEAEPVYDDLNRLIPWEPR